MARKEHLDVVMGRLSKVHGETVKIVPSSYVGVGYKATFCDSEFGAWDAKVSHVLNGCGHPARGFAKRGRARRSSIDVVCKRVADVHGEHVMIIAETYTKVSSLATFIDSRHGQFRATPNNVYRGNCHPTCHHERSMRSSSQCKIITHWRTGEELCCVGGYEVAFVRWCNHHHIDFEWQITHPMPDGRTYRIDAHITSGEHGDTWVEIKGFFRGRISKEKWDWFQSEHHNSKLWDGERLKVLGVLDFHPKSTSNV